MEGKKRHQLVHSDDHDEEEMIFRSEDHLKAKGRHLYLFMQADGTWSYTPTRTRYQPHTYEPPKLMVRVAALIILYCKGTATW